MEDTIFGHPIWGGLIPIILGVAMLILSKVAHRIKPKFWKNWWNSRDKVSFNALGILFVSLGAIDLIDIFLGIPSLVFWFAPIILFITIFLLILKRAKKFPSWWVGYKQIITFICHFALTIAILLLLRWPWAVYEYGIEWTLPDIFKFVFFLSYIIGTIIVLTILVKLLLSGVADIFKAKIKK